MTNHDMRLHEEPFNMIEAGIKNIEYRLNDEKRRLIKIGDTITFYKRPSGNEKIKVLVMDLKHYSNLLDMYKATFNKHLKGLYENAQAAVDDTPYYSEEEVEKYGCVAIRFKKM